MKKAIIIWGAVILLSGNISAQPHPPDSIWSQIFGGSGYDGCNSVQQTVDEGYILAGSVCPSMGAFPDFLIIKTDKNGDSLWSRTFGGIYNELCFSVQQTIDGGYIFAGFTDSFGAGWYDFWLLKTDEDGDSLWSRTFGGNIDDGCYDMQQTEDGGYILAGETLSFGAGQSDFWLVKTNETGDSLWSNSFGGNNAEYCFSVQQTSDGGYILAGYTGSFGAGAWDFWLVKADENGDSLWSRTFGGNGTDRCLDMQETSGGGFILAGNSSSFSEDSDLMLIKTDENGDLLWGRTYGGDGCDNCKSLQQTSDGGYILAGSTSSFGAGYGDFWLLKTNERGDSLWSSTFGGFTIDYCNSVQQTSDGGYILAGETLSFGPGYGDIWLIKTDPEFVGVEDFPSFSIPNNFSLSPPCPNPFNPMTQITFTLPKGADVSVIVYDINGREVSQIVNEWHTAGTHQAIFDGSGLSSGLYFARLIAGDFSQTRKLVLVK